MPHPSSVYAAKHFPTQAQRDAYAEGLEIGANFNAQGYGSDPFRVRTEDDLTTNRFYAFLQRGTYEGNEEVYR